MAMWRCGDLVVIRAVATLSLVLCLISLYECIRSFRQFWSCVHSVF